MQLIRHKLLRRASSSIALLAALCCGGATGADAGGRSRPDIVVFVIDTLRADRVGTYGHDVPTTPNIDALARHGVVFTEASAPAPWTLPSVVSMMTATFPCEHGVLVEGQRVREELVPFAQHLQRAGYSTWSFVSNGFAGKSSGLDRGFDHHVVLASISGDTLRYWFRPPDDHPMLLYLHDVRPHDPYQAPVAPLGEPDAVGTAARNEANRHLDRYRRLTKLDFDASRPLGTTDNSADQQQEMTWLAERRALIEKLYDAEVRAADEIVGEVVSELKRIGRWDQTLFVLASDHGEEFDDHGGWQHDQSLYQELIRVPLIVRLPGDEGAGRRGTTPVSLVDLVPTVSELLDLPDMARNARGRSWLPALRGGVSERERTRVVAERHNEKKFFAPFVATRGHRNVAVREGSWKAIWSVEPDTLELYDLAVDPDEKRDRSVQEPARAAAMKRFAREWLAGCRIPDRPVPTGAIDDADLERLRALGYVE